MYILPRSTNVLSFLHNSVIWIWWGSAPPAPNVETPLVLILWKSRAGPEWAWVMRLSWLTQLL